MSTIEEVIQNQETELDFYNTQKQIQSNRNLAIQLQKEENNFGFKPQFDTQGNSNLAERIGRAELSGASDEDIDIILAEHDYVRSSMLKPNLEAQRTPQPNVNTSSSTAVVPTPSRVLTRLPTPKKLDKPDRPDKTPTKIVKKVEEKAMSLVDKLMNHLPLIILTIILSFLIYKIFYSPLKGSKSKGKGKGKGKKK